jgi:hypothetical protein
MDRITEAEFRRMIDGILDDKEQIIRHNPIGTDEEILLWMLLNSLVMYLSLSELETPCFNGRPDAAVYRDAIEYVLRDRKAGEFDAAAMIDKLSEK